MSDDDYTPEDMDRMYRRVAQARRQHALGTTFGNRHNDRDLELGLQILQDAQITTE